jgi:hypothetical protein
VGFLPTGITLEIQDDVLGLNVNGLTPRKWCVKNALQVICEKGLWESIEH